ncbi:MAG: acyl-CoA dehydratase activase-related protein, partial [Bacillota bacterium]
MVIGIPKALLYYKYHAFATAFFEALGARVVVSPDTNRRILDTGALVCADEACLPVKVMHGHAAWLQGRCDALLAPRFMRMAKGKSICPMFCGLPDMLRAALPGLPPLIDAPVWSLNEPERWALIAGRGLAGKSALLRAVQEGLMEQRALPDCPEPEAERYR